jgi:hypothetical protein
VSSVRRFICAREKGGSMSKSSSNSFRAITGLSSFAILSASTKYFSPVLGHVIFLPCSPALVFSSLSKYGLSRSSVNVSARLSESLKRNSLPFPGPIVLQHASMELKERRHLLRLHTIAFRW